LRMAIGEGCEVFKNVARCLEVEPVSDDVA
jgi:hypothetical protein